MGKVRVGTPCVRELDLGLYAAWSCACAYVVSLSLISWYRFRQGAWRDMRVVEARE
jgi:Na+-driven multidrug efflux pump